MGVVGVVGEKPGFSLPATQALDRQLSIDGNNHHLAVRCLHAAVHHQQISIVNAGTDHGFALSPNEERCAGLSHQMRVEVQGSFQIIVRR